MDNEKKVGQVEAVASEKRVLLKNGLIVDGTGSKGFAGDLLIRGSRIEKVSRGSIDFDGKTLDCTGKVISPGFIDIHSHMDQVLPFQGCENLRTPFIVQGCTTFVAGNCGASGGSLRKGNPYMNQLAYDQLTMDVTWPDMAGYFNHLEEIGLSHNLVNLAGNGTTRTCLRGPGSNPLDQEEMKELLRRLEEDMDQGAAGVSFGLQYSPDILHPGRDHGRSPIGEKQGQDHYCAWPRLLNLVRGLSPGP